MQKNSLLKFLTATALFFTFFSLPVFATDYVGEQVGKCISAMQNASGFIQSSNEIAENGEIMQGAAANIDTIRVQTSPKEIEKMNEENKSFQKELKNLKLKLESLISTKAQKKHLDPINNQISIAQKNIQRAKMAIRYYENNVGDLPDRQRRQKLADIKRELFIQNIALKKSKDKKDKYLKGIDEAVELVQKIEDIEKSFQQLPKFITDPS